MFRSRLALLIVFFSFAIVGALMYAGGQATLVSLQLATDGTMLILWLASAMGYGSIWLWIIPRPGTDRPAGELLLRGVTSAALGLGTISLLTLAFGLAGWMNHTMAVGLIGVGMILALLAIVRSKVSPAAIAVWSREPAGAAWLLLSAAPMLSIALIGAMLPPGILWRVGDPSFYDVVEYHLEVPREWYELGRIVPLSHNVFSFFPFNVEMHYLLAMHLNGGPWTGMYLAQLMHVAFIVLAVLAFYAVALRWSGALMATTATLLVASTPWLTQLAAVAYDEGGFLLFGTLAIGWAGRALFETPQKTRLFILAGAMAGLACGVKLTAVPEVLGLPILAILVSTCFMRQKSFRYALRGGILFAVTAMLLFSPWLVRNEIWAGNPVFPEATTLQLPGRPDAFRGEFTAEQIVRWNTAHTARPDQQNLAARSDALWKEVFTHWQFGYLLFPMAAIGAGFGLTRGDRRAIAVFVGILLLGVTVFWMCFTHLQGRFAVLMIPLAGWLVAQIDRGPRRLAVAVVLLVGLVSVSLDGWRLNAELSTILYGGANSPFPQPMQSLLAMPDLSAINANLLDGLTPGQPLVLIGDAKAFFYPVPIRQLHYRTVFDVRCSDADLITDWADGKLPPGARVIVDPSELRRFHATYRHIPPVPDWITRKSPDGSTPFILSGRTGGD